VALVSDTEEKIHECEKWHFKCAAPSGMDGGGVSFRGIGCVLKKVSELQNIRCFKLHGCSIHKWTPCLNYNMLYRGADKSLARPDWKSNWKVAIFRPTRRSLLPRRPGWTDNLLNLFWMACKSSSLFAVACFLPGRAKDLSAPRYVMYVYVRHDVPEHRSCHGMCIGCRLSVW